MKKAVVLAILISIVDTSQGLAQSRSPATPPVDGGGWRKIGSNSTLDYWFSPRRLIALRGGKWRAWIKRSLRPGDASLKELLADLRGSGYSTEGYEDFRYSLLLIEVDCTQRKTRTIHATDYAADRQELDSRIPPRPTWKDVEPGSFIEMQLDAVCAAAKRQKRR